MFLCITNFMILILFMLFIFVILISCDITSNRSFIVIISISDSVEFHISPCIIGPHIQINKQINVCQSAVRFCWHHFLKLNFAYILNLQTLMSLASWYLPCNDVSCNRRCYQIISYQHNFIIECSTWSFFVGTGSWFTGLEYTLIVMSVVI